MIKNKKRAIPNFFIALVLAGGISWVGGKFIHLGDVEYTDNAQVKTAFKSDQYPRTRFH